MPHKPWIIYLLVPQYNNKKCLSVVLYLHTVIFTHSDINILDKQNPLKEDEEIALFRTDVYTYQHYFGIF